MQISFPHKQSKAEAIERVKSMLEESRAKIAENATDVKTDWNDSVLSFEFTAQGSHISGTLTVQDESFDLYAKLPLMYRMFEGTIERMIKAEIAKMNI